MVNVDSLCSLAAVSRQRFDMDTLSMDESRVEISCLSKDDSSYPRRSTAANVAAWAA